MGINKESNSYIIGFSTVLVVIVGALLAYVAIALKPYQNANVQNEKKQYILKAINVMVERDQAAGEFNNYVKNRMILSYDGKVLSEKSGDIDKFDELDAFNVDLLKEYKTLDKENRNYPLFVCEKNGKPYYVVPVLGTGLWAAVWGYIGFEEDFNTIHGSVFDHKSETPGLGAEISKDFFGEQFVGKTIAKNDKFTSIKVVKPGTPPSDAYDAVDGISGGTFTSVGVDEMISRTAVVYYDYFKSIKKQETAAIQTEVVEQTTEELVEDTENNINE
jgi:Na+-transporting NADH:ubiquinone oxidoreductase subunit C